MRKGGAVRYILTTAVCTLGLALLGGCGLVVVPTFRRFPGPVKAVRVADAETKAPIAGPRVHVQIRRVENWFVQMPMLARDSAETKGEWEPLEETEVDI